MPDPLPVLLIDDDRELCRLLTTYLEDEGFKVEASYDGAAGLKRAVSGEHSLLILDVMLPDLNGFDVLRELREVSEVPVLMLTARGRDTDRVVGLEMGADDYLPKPFNPRELLARMRAILRRAPQPERTPRVVVGELRLDCTARTVTLAGQPLSLTTTEFDLLEALARQAGRPVSRETLCRKVLGRAFSPLDRSLDVHISNLRRKLPGSGQQRIKTVRNHGYLYAVESPG